MTITMTNKIDERKAMLREGTLKRLHTDPFSSSGVTSNMQQTITSAETSLKQVPAVFKLINKAMVDPELFWGTTREILDYGGGKYDLLTEKLAELGVRNLVLDPFNRSEDHNKLVRQLLTVRPADHAICSNVLNVIKEPAVRQEVLRDIAALVRPGGYVFVTVYEGNRSSRGRRTTKGWQTNRPLKSYIRELRKVFKEGWFAKGVPNMLICGTHIDTGGLK